MNVQEQVGLAIQRFRRSKHLSQDELAHRSGIDQAYLSRIESGRTDIGVRLLVKISRALCVQPTELIAGIDVTAIDTPEGETQ